MPHVFRWGHVLPEGLVGKGLGSRAFLHALKSGCVMHDSSYSCPIELRGSKQVLQQLLEQVRCHTSFFLSHTETWHEYCSMMRILMTTWQGLVHHTCIICRSWLQKFMMTLVSATKAAAGTSAGATAGVTLLMCAS